MVPACEADAQRVERGEDPEAREVLVGGRRMPYWNAGPGYAPFAGGLFGGFGGGLLPGLMVGTLLGSSLGGWGMGDAYASGDGGDWRRRRLRWRRLRWRGLRRRRRGLRRRRLLAPHAHDGDPAALAEDDHVGLRAGVPHFPTQRRCRSCPVPVQSR